MKNNLKLLIFACLIPSCTYAQETVIDSVGNEIAEEFDFSLTEGQLDEDAEAASTVTLVQSAKDPYINEVGWRWSAMRFKYRALDNAYVGNYFNGVKLNNVENGRSSYSSVGGLNDATRSKTGVGFLDQCDFGYAPLGGATNTNVRASNYAAGSKAGIALTNRNYYLRATYTYATGVLKNGWAFMGSIAYRYAKEGVIEGTFYNSFAFMLGAEKKWGDRHSLALNIWGAPTERGQQGASTEEAYALAGSHYYNPYWGYQNGEKRNSRVVTEFSPTALLTWDWKINESTKLTTTAALTYSKYASTALNYFNGYNPRPDYYKNLPSSVFNVYDAVTFNNGGFLTLDYPGLLDQYNALYENFSGSKANRQVQWDMIYAQNEANNATGKNALYYLEKRHNDQLAFNLSSVLDGEFSTHGKYTLGINLNSTKGIHYKTMADLLGASTFVDIDSYSLSDYGNGSPVVQNDADNPNRRISAGDRFGYDYNIYVNKIKGFGTNVWKFGNFTATYGADIEATWIERYGKMRNGRALEYSKGSSGVADFLGGGGKATLQYKIATSFLYVGGSFESQAPLAYNSFVAPRIQNNFVNNLKNERYWNAEAGYQWYFGPISGKISAYYTRFADVAQQTAFYNDDAGYLTYLSMTGIKKEYKGLEAAITVKLTNNLKLNLLGTISDAKYINNPSAQLAYEGSDASTINNINYWENPVTGKKEPLIVVMDGVKVGSTPLTAASVGLNYYIKGWYFNIALNYYDRVYIDAAPYRRLGKIIDNYITDSHAVNYYTAAIANAYSQAKASGGVVFDATTEAISATYTQEQEKFKGGFMLDASIGRSIYLKGGKRLSINLQLQNLTNNTNMKTGGYEQNRADRSTYIFTKNSYYYYASAINAFLNCSLIF